MVNTIRIVEEHSLRIRYSESRTGIKEKEILNASIEHLNILKALKEGNGDFAANIVSEHIINARERTLTIFHN